MPPTISQKTVRGLRDDPAFGDLSKVAKGFVIDFVGKRDPGFQGLSPEARSLVVDRLTAERGPLGIFTPEFRQSRKEKVEKMSGIERFITGAFQRVPLH